MCGMAPRMAIPCSMAVVAGARWYFILLCAWVWLFIHVALNHVVRLNRDVRHAFGANMYNAKSRTTLDDGWC